MKFTGRRRGVLRYHRIGRRHGDLRYLLIGLVFCIAAGVAIAQPNPEISPFVSRVVSVRDSLLAVYNRLPDGVERDWLAFQLGMGIKEDAHLFPPSDPDVGMLHWLSLLKKGNPAAVQPQVEALVTGFASFPQGAPHLTRHLYYTWLTIIDNLAPLAALEEQANSAMSDQVFTDRRPPFAPEYLALGELAFHRFDYDLAGQYYTRILKAPSDSDPYAAGYYRRLALAGVCRILERRQQFQAMFDTLSDAILNQGMLDDDLAVDLADALIRLGRIRESSAILKLTLELNPHHQFAHYYLGNGYAEYNYTELQSLYPGCFADTLNADWLEAQRLFADGSSDSARVVLASLLTKHPDWLEPRAMLAELDLLAGDFDAAERNSQAMLATCPDYGRAHAILAKVSDFRTLRVGYHYEDDEADFAATEMPQVPAIEKYVVNWASLSSRHQKRVALSVAPWQNFIPTLVATGHTHYIKPLHEKLSQCPDMETLRDQRIGLDSRLWDDVRGAGGYHTITGIEDVERIIFRRYNTVLHELTHQVHGILTDPEKRMIEDAYRAAKAREALVAQDSVPAFLTRYAASNEWEYFAEGVNSYHSPRRDEFDDRELVRERLFEIDTALVRLVEHFTSVADMAPYLVVGRVRAAEELLERGRADSALVILDALPASDRDDRAVLSALIEVKSILDDDSGALEAGRRLVERHPDEAEGYLKLSKAQRHSVAQVSVPADAGGTDAAIQTLQKGLMVEGLASRERLMLELADLYRDRGWYGQALAWYDSAVAVQQDLPRAIWGRAVAWGDSANLSVLVAQDSVPAVNRALLQQSLKLFEAVIPERSGVAELRLDYARILLQAGRMDEANLQLAEAENLKPDDASVWTYRAWWRLAKGDSANAKELLDKVMQTPAPPDLARILQARMEGSGAGQALFDEYDSHTPRYVFNPSEFRYETRGELKAWQRRLLLIK